MAAQSAIADPSVKELAARTEGRPTEGLMPSGQQVLTGRKSTAKWAVIAGELRLPQGAAGRLPAVVLMHGSGGAGAREEFWSKIFNETASHRSWWTASPDAVSPAYRRTRRSWDAST